MTEGQYESGMSGNISLYQTRGGCDKTNQTHQLFWRMRCFFMMSQERKLSCLSLVKEENFNADSLFFLFSVESVYVFFSFTYTLADALLLQLPAKTLGAIRLTFCDTEWYHYRFNEKSYKSLLYRSHTRAQVYKTEHIIDTRECRCGHCHGKACSHTINHKGYFQI